MKNKVVTYHPHYGARIHVAEDVSKISAQDGETLFVNPNTTAVVNFPPELWSLEDGKFVPLTDESAIERRIFENHSRPAFVRASDTLLEDLREAIERTKLISKIPTDFSWVEHRFDDLPEEIFPAYRQMMAQLQQNYAEIRSQRLWFIALFILNLLILGGALYGKH